ncbi:MAG TPA: OmpH family outer membrane protein [Spirochaetia bacterium]|nr:OmpH family outer membrane protein [Spirochaetia bacterium]
MRKLVPVIIALICGALPAAAQQVTKVGICDFTRVLSTAYKESKAYRDYDAAKNDYTKEVAATTRDITDMENQKLDADKAGNKDLSLSLEKKIADRKAYLENYRRVKLAILQQQADRLLSGPVLKEIMDVVNYIAEGDGYALVLRSDGDFGSGILYRIMEIDITDKVIKELFTRAGKTYSGGQ